MIRYRRTFKLLNNVICTSSSLNSYRDLKICKESKNSGSVCSKLQTLKDSKKSSGPCPSKASKTRDEPCSPKTRDTCSGKETKTCTEPPKELPCNGSDRPPKEPPCNGSDRPPKELPCNGSDDGNHKWRYGIIGVLLLALTAGLLYGILHGSDDDDKLRRGVSECDDEDEEEQGGKDKRKRKKKRSVIGKRERVPLEIEKVPSNPKDLPQKVQYLLVGGGAASFAAFRSIKSLDPKAQILIITDESEYPYMRPPLSKELWFNDNPQNTEEFLFTQWNSKPRSIQFESDGFYTDVKKINSEKGGVSVALGWKVTKINLSTRDVELDGKYKISYDKCLLATGGQPKNIPPFKYADDNTKKRLFFFKTKHDFEDLHHMVSGGEISSATVVGGGCLGCELAYSLASFGNGKFKVNLVFKEKGPLGKVLPEYLSSWTSKQLEKQGVSLIPEATINDCCMKHNSLELKLTNGRIITTDITILAVGSEPNIQLAKDSGLEVHPELGGFLVNSELQANSNVYVAGDAACFYDPKLGRRRIEHHDHALVSGRLAGENMAGANKAYTHQSMFWSDLGPSIGFEAIGLVDSSLPTVAVFAKTEPDKKKDGCDDEFEESEMKEEDFCKGVVFYLRDEVVVGILMWNILNKMQVARQVLAEGRKYDDLNEVAKLFNIHDIS